MKIVSLKATSQNLRRRRNKMNNNEYVLAQLIAKVTDLEKEIEETKQTVRILSRLLHDKAIAIPPEEPEGD